MAHHDAVGHASPDLEYADTPAGAGHEHTDASIWIVAKFIIWLTISSGIISIGIALMYAMFIARAKELGEQPYPLATSQEQRLPPAPRLQQFPRNELYEFRTKEDRDLQSYGWVDQKAGTVRLPISEAMRLIVERGGLPVRAQEPRPEDAVRGLMPSDSSSGRTMERRR